jgi:hypothetical protein
MRALLLFLAALFVLHADAQNNTGSGIPRPEAVPASGDLFVQNNFIGSFRMELHLFKNGKEEKSSPTTMLYWSGEDMTLYQLVMAGQKAQDMKVLVDLKGQLQYMLMTDEQGGRTAMKSIRKAIPSEKEAGAKAPDITVTNETRTIEGRVCTKVVAKSTEGTWTGWVAGDLKSPFADMARSIGKDNERMTKGGRGIQGMPLEYEFVSAVGGEKFVGYIKDLKVGTPDPALFSLDGYEVKEMPAFSR